MPMELKFSSEIFEDNEVLINNYVNKSILPVPSLFDIHVYLRLAGGY